MRATVEGVPFHAGEPFTGHARLPDVGPIAFRDVAIVLPRSAARDGHARVRLAFVADNWRIDEVRVAGTLSRPAVTTLAVARVVVPTACSRQIQSSVRKRQRASVQHGEQDSAPGSPVERRC